MTVGTKMAADHRTARQTFEDLIATPADGRGHVQARLSPFGQSIGGAVPASPEVVADGVARGWEFFSRGIYTTRYDASANASAEQ